MTLYFMILAILGLMVAGFIAGFFDSIVGGSGVITLPALLSSGISPYMALGTNKIASTFASSTSSWTYFRSGHLERRLLLWMIPFTFVGALCGAETVLHVDQHYLQIIILIAILVIAMMTWLKRDLGQANEFIFYPLKTRIIAMFIAFALGFYDGFIGPGTGSFLLFTFLAVFRFDFITAVGNGRALNFTSNTAALLWFIIQGKVVYLYGLPMGFAMMIGARVGSRMAIRKGVPLIRPLFIVVSIVLSMKMALTVFG